jgi:hypothetical protein
MPVGLAGKLKLPANVGGEASALALANASTASAADSDASMATPRLATLVVVLAPPPHMCNADLIALSDLIAPADRHRPLGLTSYILGRFVWRLLTGSDATTDPNPQNPCI